MERVSIGLEELYNAFTGKGWSVRLGRIRSECVCVCVCVCVSLEGVSVGLGKIGSPGFLRIPVCWRGSI